MSEMAKTAATAPPADAFDEYVQHHRKEPANVGMLGVAINTIYGHLEAAFARIKKLEQQPALEHAGPWRSGSTYAAGNLVQHKGGCWLARHDTTARPGEADESSRVWVLVAKSGRDADDTRELRRRIDQLEKRLATLEHR